LTKYEKTKQYIHIFEKNICRPKGRKVQKALPGFFRQWYRWFISNFSCIQPPTENYRWKFEGDGIERDEEGEEEGEEEEDSKTNNEDIDLSGDDLVVQMGEAGQHGNEVNFSYFGSAYCGVIPY
jgi:hypothetical protein